VRTSEGTSDGCGFRLDVRPSRSVQAGQMDKE
jgi:hypothetical protein